MLITLSSAQTSPAQQELKIQISGIHDRKIKQNLVKNIHLGRFRDFDVASKNQIQRMLNKAQSDIKILLQPYGYYKPTISGELKHSGKKRTVHFNIDLNKPLRITVLRIEIIGEPNDQKIFEKNLEVLPLQTGKILTQDDYEATKQNLQNTAFNRGFLDAQLTQHEIHINAEKYTAQILITLEIGSQYHIGNIKIKQKRFIYGKSFINRLIGLETGKKFTQNKVIKATKRLQESDYFSRAQIIPQITKRDTKQKRVHLDIDLASNYARTYSFGLGYGTFTGPRVSFGTVFRHITTTGQQLSFNIQASPANTSFETGYTFPGNDPLNDNWNVNAQQQHIKTDTYNERQTNVGINRNHKYGRWYSTLSLQQYFTSYKTADDNSDNETYFVPGVSLRYHGIKKDGFWHKGFIWNNLLQASPKMPFSNESFIRNMMNATFFLPLNQNWNRIILEGHLGATAVSNIQNIAPNFRFYAGGVGNLLGYPYLSQGPKVGNNVIGGKFLATGFAGIEQRVYGNFSTMLYYNLGNASNKLNFSDVDILQAGGIGLSYQSPLGPLIVMLSRTLTPGYKTWQIDVNIGVNV